MAVKASIPDIKKGAGFFKAFSSDVNTEDVSPTARLQKRYALLGSSLQFVIGAGVFLFSWSLAVLLFSPYPKPDIPPNDEVIGFTDSLEVDTTAVLKVDTTAVNDTPGQTTNMEENEMTSDPGTSAGAAKTDNRGSISEKEQQVLQNTDPGLGAQRNKIREQTANKQQKASLNPSGSTADSVENQKQQYEQFDRQDDPYQNKDYYNQQQQQ
jgi:hypothetical protein